MQKETSNPPMPEGSVVPVRESPSDSCSVRLSERDAVDVLASAANPPTPNEAARNAAKRFLKHNG
jgi:hypothetical protein